MPGASSVARERAAPRRFLAKVFVGKDGLRAGWSALIFVIASAALLIAVKALFDKHTGLRSDEFRLSDFAVREIILAGGSLLLTLIMSKIEQRPFKIYGFDGPRPLLTLFIGAVWGVVCVSLLIVVLRLFGLLTFTSLALHGPDIVRYGLEWGFVFFLAGLFEEVLFRGFILYTLTRGLAQIYGRRLDDGLSRQLGFWTASIILGSIFFAIHTSHPGDGPIGLFAAFAASLAFSVSIWRTGSLWWIIGFHAAWDWSQSFLYGVGDSGIFVDHRLTTSYPAGSPLLSGGLTGPEGSLFVLPILLLCSLIAAFTLRGGGYERKLPKLRDGSQSPQNP